ncbi:DUF2283 domain-containing protein [bacterium]|nr:DUF2283 domain-containing protein [bacterium]
MLKINYDAEGDILEIKFSDEKVTDSAYAEENGIVVDYDKTGKILGLEILAFSKRARNPEELTSISV